jgi:AraC-like DNA-binding protein/mannose-6-phosphate isomerase-like protein (cupin superfamily)
MAKKASRSSPANGSFDSLKTVSAPRAAPVVFGGSPAPARHRPLNRQKFFELDRLHLGARLGSYKVEWLYWGVLGERPWRNYQHAHSFFEFCYAYAGRGTYRVRDRDLPVEKGELFLATPGVSHEIVSSRAQPLGIYFWALTLVRAPDPTYDHAASPARPHEGQERREGELSRPIDALLEGLAHPPALVARPHGAALGRTLELLTEEIADKPPGYTQAALALAGKLLLDAARTFTPGVASEALAEQDGEKRGVVATAVRYLRDNYARPIEVRDVAAQVHLSERHLARIFARETGRSIVEFLTDLRIEAASGLLLDDHTPIKQIARAVGYPDPHYFTTLFGKKTGMTPGAFRSLRGTKFVDEAKRPPSLRR